jgi:outer membrane protein OmpA-like peptidoglycan-associated protein
MIFAATALLLGAEGCVATRAWVNDQTARLDSRIDGVEGKADRALAGLENLHLERRLVIDSKGGPNFAFGSAGLAPEAKERIDRFFRELEETAKSDGKAGGRVFVITGHTDSVGPEDYNYELAERRASRVAGYVLAEKGVDPMRIHVASYGPSKPVADNHSRSGRRQNRRVEILVYQEKITAGMFGL